MTKSKKTLFGIFVILIISMVAFRWHEFFAGAEIKQPLEFSHKVHTEAVQCEDCHADIKKPYYAGLPDIKVCMGCHQGEPVSNSPEEKKLINYINNNKEISWKRLYKTPVHVYFSHNRHVSVAKLECETCHGAIGKTVKPPGKPLVAIEMSNCITCHKKNNVDTSCVTCHK
jgi:hypothetical protein